MCLGERAGLMRLVDTSSPDENFSTLCHGRHGNQLSVGSLGPSVCLSGAPAVSWRHDLDRQVTQVSVGDIDSRRKVTRSQRHCQWYWRHDNESKCLSVMLKAGERWHGHKVTISDTEGNRKVTRSQSHYQWHWRQEKGDTITKSLSVTLKAIERWHSHKATISDTEDRRKVTRSQSHCQWHWRAWAMRAWTHKCLSVTLKAG